MKLELTPGVSQRVLTPSVSPAGSESGSGLLGQPADANGPVFGFFGGTLAAPSDPNSWSRVGNNGTGNFSSQYSPYAVSSVLTAPEPASLGLLARRRRRA